MAKVKSLEKKKELSPFTAKDWATLDKLFEYAITHANIGLRDFELIAKLTDYRTTLIKKLKEHGL